MTPRHNSATRSIRRVTIERHGRLVLVVLSEEEFDDIEAMELERLRAEVQKGLESSARVEVIDIDETHKPGSDECPRYCWIKYGEKATK